MARFDDEARFKALSRKSAPLAGEPEELDIQRLVMPGPDPIEEIASTLEAIMPNIDPEKRPLVEKALDLLRQAASGGPPPQEETRRVNLEDVLGAVPAREEEQRG